VTDAGILRAANLMRCPPTCCNRQGRPPIPRPPLHFRPPPFYTAAAAG